MLIVSLLLASAVNEPASMQIDKGKNQLEPLVATRTVKDGEKQPMLCTNERRWCALINVKEGSGVSALSLFENPPRTGGARPFATHTLEGETSDSLFKVWPHIVRLGGGKREIMVGVEQQTFNGYAGGGGSASILSLYRVSRDEKGLAVLTGVLTMTISAAVMIRACFNEKDTRDRLGACHDEYGYSTKLRLAPVPQNGMPRFEIQTEASTYPRDISRNRDSSARGKLSKRDLVRTRNAKCSYRRTLAYDNKTKSYVTDRPEPDCTEFTVP